MTLVEETIAARTAPGDGLGVRHLVTRVTTAADVSAQRVRDSPPGVEPAEAGLVVPPIGAEVDCGVLEELAYLDVGQGRGGHLHEGGRTGGKGVGQGTAVYRLMVVRLQGMTVVALLEIRICIRQVVVPLGAEDVESWC